MKSKTVKRYYCDFCRKGGFKKPDMQQHESSCTMNPKRQCFLCGGSIGIAEIIIEMKKRQDVFDQSEDQDGSGPFQTESKAAIEWLNSQCADCPACMLSVLRQGKIYNFDVFNYRFSCLLASRI